MGKLCGLSNIPCKTESSFLEGQTAYFVGHSERNGLPIYLLGTYQLLRSLPGVGDTEDMF